MRTYRGCWTVLVTLVTGASLLLVWVRQSPWLLLGEVVTVAVMGLALGASWVDDPRRRWRLGRTWASRGVVTAVILTGLPHLIGSWALLVLVAGWALSPDLIRTAARREVRRRTPDAACVLGDVPDDELARRWRTSSIAVRSSWRTPAEVLVLVLERERLLDELELRNPEAFTRWLVAAGWRESPSR